MRFSDQICRLLAETSLLNNARPVLTKSTGLLLSCAPVTPSALWPLTGRPTSYSEYRSAVFRVNRPYDEPVALSFDVE